MTKPTTYPSFMSAFAAATVAAAREEIEVYVYRARGNRDEYRLGLTRGRHWAGYCPVAVVRPEDMVPAPDRYPERGDDAIRRDRIRRAQRECPTWCL